MNTKPASHPTVAVRCHLETTLSVNRRAFLRQSLAWAGASAIGVRAAAAPEAQEPLQPVGEAKGIHPGRVVWAHDPDLTDWKGPGDGHWWEGDRVRQARVDTLLTRSLCALTGERTAAEAWSRLFRHANQNRGKGDVGYRPGERITIKPNWVGLIYRWRPPGFPASGSTDTGTTHGTSSTRATSASATASSWSRFERQPRLRLAEGRAPRPGACATRES